MKKASRKITKQESKQEPKQESKQISVSGSDWMGFTYSAIIRLVEFIPNVQPGGKVYAVLGDGFLTRVMFEAEVDGGWWEDGKKVVIYADSFEKAKSYLDIFLNNSN